MKNVKEIVNNTNLSRESKIDKIAVYANEILKEAVTYKDLQDLIDIIEYSQSEDCYINLEMKRTGYTPFHFIPWNEEGTRVEYLIDDGVSVGKSYIKNLSRNIRVR